MIVKKESDNINLDTVATRYASTLESTYLKQNVFLVYEIHTFAFAWTWIKDTKMVFSI